MIRTIIKLRDTPLTQKERNDPYEMHRTLERVYDGKRHRWRCEGMRLVIHSLGIGDWYRLPKGYVESIEGGVVGATETGERCRFQLRANAVRVANQTGRRTAIECPLERFKWLFRQAGHNGFMLEQIESTDPVWYMPRNSKGIQMKVSEFTGRLIVTNPELFNQALLNGVGKGRGFGCGLIHLVDATNGGHAK